MSVECFVIGHSGHDRFEELIDYYEARLNGSFKGRGELRSRIEALFWQGVQFAAEASHDSRILREVKPLTPSQFFAKQERSGHNAVAA